MLIHKATRLNHLALRTLSVVANGQRSVIIRASRLSTSSNLLRQRENDALLLYAVRFASNDRSKVESQLQMLKEDLTRQQEEESKRLKLVPRKENEVKLTLKEKIVHELKHYYHGFRLLALETRLSSKYLWRIIRGKTLTRRERQQLVRTVSDLFRLVPFSIFIIVPFMEFALPIFIKVFPNMLPSTFREHDKEEEKLRRQVKVKVEMAKFLQDTIEEIALEKKALVKNGKETSRALEFAQFIKKSRLESGYVSNADLLRFSKLFEDELTLDNLSMSQLRAVCRLLNIPPLGSPEILRFQLKLKLRELKADDKQIAAEGGVDVLTSLDLQQACRARGMRFIGLSEDRLKEQLNQWLELSLNDNVPPSLLLLSRALFLPEDVPFTDRLKSLVSQLPEGVAEHTRQKLLEMEGGKVDHKARIALIKKIEEGIQQEKLLAAAVEKKKKADDDAKKAKEEAVKKVAEEPAPKVDVAAAAVAAQAQQMSEAVKKMSTTVATAAAIEAVKAAKEKLVEEAHKQAAATPSSAAATGAAETAAIVQTTATVAEKKAAAEKKAEHKIDKKDLSALEDVLLGGALHEAKHDITELKEKIIEHSDDLVELNTLDEAFAESKVAKRLRSKVASIVENVDTLVSKMEEKKAAIDETIADPAVPDSAREKRLNQVHVADVINRLKSIRKEYAEADASKLEVLIKALDEDSDGQLDSAIVLEVIDMLESHSDVSLSPSQLAAMVEVLKKEDRAEALENAFKGESLSGPITVQPRLPLVDDQQSSSKLTAAGKSTTASEKEQGEEGEQQKNKSLLEPPEIDPTITRTAAEATKQQQKQKNQNGKAP